MLRIHLPQRPLVAAAVVIAFFGVALAATGFILQLLGIGPDT